MVNDYPNLAKYTVAAPTTDVGEEAEAAAESEENTEGMTAGN
jgi:hypothetical protein